MLWFFFCVAVLVLGYFTYGKIIEKIFVINPKRATPAYAMNDGVDYMPMSKTKIWLIQLLNIAGTGPIFGPILGALYGPVAMLWIVIGCIFAGAVHDYFCGMLSIRNGGATMPNLAGKFLGRPVKLFINVMALILLLLVGVVFVASPAQLLSTITMDIAGATQSAMELGDVPIWPLLFLTISCGALSGFHATQTPLMARCAQNEKEGRFIFYGAMITEGVIALVWCAVGLSFYENPQALQDAISAGSPSKVVYDSSLHFLGFIGGIFAVLGVVVLPITSGDTAFRAARLQLAEIFGLEQRTLVKRLYIAVPLFVLGFIVSKVDFSVLWRYFTWANQMTAMVMLWTAAGYLYRYKKFHWVCSIPAWFITTVCATYLANNKIGFGLDYELSVYIGFAITVVCVICFFAFLKPSEARDEDAYVTN
ncbi:TPA: carbon starvation protein A [Mannheimia haemolytica]|nr:carbon starvation protein A [Mannheimia haemolytica]